MGDLLLAGLPEQGVPDDQLAYWLSAGETLTASSQPAPLPTTGGHVVLRTSPKAWFRVSARSTPRQPLTKVFRRAGCGKSARPVRRGDSRSRFRSPTVLLYSLMFCPQTRKSAAFRKAGKTRKTNS